MTQHICTEECTKIYPVELDWNDNGDLYIEQKNNLIHKELYGDYSTVIVEKEEVYRLLEELHNHWHREIWNRLETYLEEENANHRTN